MSRLGINGPLSGLCLSQQNKTNRALSYTCHYRYLVEPFKNMLICLFLTLTITTLISGPKSVGSVIMPPPKFMFTAAQHQRVAINGRDIHSSQHLKAQVDNDEPYRLTISGQDSISIGLNSPSKLIINLNRAIPELVTVRVSVNSGSNLIVFDLDKSQLNTNQTRMIGFMDVTPNSYLVEYPANEFGDRIVHFHTTDFAGHAEIVCKVVKQPSHNSIVIDDKSAFVSVDIYRSWDINVIAQPIGWIYTFAWSISFYFQVILNYKRKSVVGLNFDFLTLNLLGFGCYSIYNIALLFSNTVQQEYYKRYAYSRIPVEYNDLLFALHAFLITLVTVIQCFIYERGEQHISLPASIFATIVPTAGFAIFVASLFEGVSILYAVLYLSYVKLVITIIKYMPQAYMNYKRKATTGWSIHNIILDFTGGLFSILQMFLLAYNYDNWISIYGNFTKFGLGVISILFDIVFLLQHYVLYNVDRQMSLVNNSTGDPDNSSDSCPSPVISQSIRSTNPNQSQAPPTHNGSNVETDENSD